MTARDCQITSVVTVITSIVAVSLLSLSVPTPFVWGVFAVGILVAFWLMGDK